MEESNTTRPRRRRRLRKLGPDLDGKTTERFLAYQNKQEFQEALKTDPFLKEINEISKALADTLTETLKGGTYRRGSALSAILIVAETYIETIRKVDKCDMPECVSDLIKAITRVHDMIRAAMDKKA